MSKKKKKDQKNTKPTASSSNTDLEFFDKTLDKLSEEFGKDVIKTLEEMQGEYLVGVSSGSLALDWLINNKAGGMPKGMFLELYGRYSTGKSTIALGFCANCTANKKIALYGDFERTLSEEVVRNSGVDENYFKRIRMADGRDFTKYVAALMKTGAVGVLVIDSVPNFKPIMEPKKGQDESDVDPTKPKIAFAAGFQSEAFPYLLSVASDHNVLVILLNQIRKNVSGYGDPEMSYGGEVLKHVISVRVRFKGGIAVKGDHIRDEDGHWVGQWIQAVCDKNKTSVPMRTADIPIIGGIGIHPYMELAKLAPLLGVVEGTSGRYKFPGSEKQIAHGEDNFVQAMFDDLELYKKVRSGVIQKLGLRYDPELKIVNAYHDSDFNKRDHLQPTEEVDNEEESEE